MAPNCHKGHHSEDCLELNGKSVGLFQDDLTPRKVQPPQLPPATRPRGSFATSARIRRDRSGSRGAARQRLSTGLTASSRQHIRSSRPHYWHLLIWDHNSHSLAGAQRLRFSRLNPTASGSATSYLEHCYPGIDETLTQTGHSYIELGRVFVSPEHQQEMRILPALIRSTVMLMQDTKHDWTLGMLSYNHLKQKTDSVYRFLSRIQQKPFNIELPIVKPRHSFETPNTKIRTGIIKRDESCNSYRSLEKSIQEDDHSFKIPRLAALYDYVCKSKVASISVAKDFNQIVEILMAGSLSSAPPLLRHQGLSIERCPVWATSS